eukprot:gene5230-6511_t
MSDFGKAGSGGLQSSQYDNIDKRERLKQIALESIDISKDPYIMPNHVGSFDCKLCLTMHNNVGNYLAHTQGKKHQTNLARRAAKEQKDNPNLKPSIVPKKIQPRKTIKIGRPGYKIIKQRDPDTKQHSLLFQIDYPEIEQGLQPRHRFMSSFEQRVEPLNKDYQYLLFAAEPYETIAFKIPNKEIDRTTGPDGKFFTHWDRSKLTFTQQQQQQQQQTNNYNNNNISEQQQQQQQPQQQQVPQQPIKLKKNIAVVIPSTTRKIIEDRPRKVSNAAEVEMYFKLKERETDFAQSLTCAEMRLKVKSKIQVVQEQQKEGREGEDKNKVNNKIGDSIKGLSWRKKKRKPKNEEDQMHLDFLKRHYAENKTSASTTTSSSISTTINSNVSISSAPSTSSRKLNGSGGGNKKLEKLFNSSNSNNINSVGSNHSNHQMIQNISINLNNSLTNSGNNNNTATTSTDIDSIGLGDSFDNTALNMSVDNSEMDSGIIDENGGINNISRFRRLNSSQAIFLKSNDDYNNPVLNFPNNDDPNNNNNGGGDNNQNNKLSSSPNSSPGIKKIGGKILSFFTRTKKNDGSNTSSNNLLNDNNYRPSTGSSNNQNNNQSNGNNLYSNNNNQFNNNNNPSNTIITTTSPTITTTTTTTTTTNSTNEAFLNRTQSQSSLTYSPRTQDAGGEYSVFSQSLQNPTGSGTNNSNQQSANHPQLNRSQSHISLQSKSQFDNNDSKNLNNSFNEDSDHLDLVYTKEKISSILQNEFDDFDDNSFTSTISASSSPISSRSASPMTSPEPSPPQITFFKTIHISHTKKPREKS